MKATAGILFVVATPIGNRADLSARAAGVLCSVALIAAEDTRHSARLLGDLGIQTPRVSLHEHNERARSAELIGRLHAGESVAVISDAGTPLVSDPGYELVRAARRAGIEVRTVPGPCAAIAALSIAGLASDRFVFEGFLPAKVSARRRRLDALADESRTLIFYESGRRLASMASDMAERFGEDRALVVARELTKRHEQSVDLRAADVASWLSADSDRTRGEFVICVEGAPLRAAANETVVDLDRLLTDLLALTGTREAARIGARATGLARNEVYRRALALR